MTDVGLPFIVGAMFGITLTVIIGGLAISHDPIPLRRRSAMSDALVTKVAEAIHAEVKAWRLQTDGSGRYRAVKNGYSRELMGGATREEAEAAFEALVDEQCARAAIAICAAKPHLLPTMETAHDN